MSGYLDAAVARCRLPIRVRYAHDPLYERDLYLTSWQIHAPLFKFFSRDPTEATAAYLRLVSELERHGD